MKWSARSRTSSLPLAERGQVDVEDAQPVEEVAPEPAGGHLGRQVAVGGGEEPDIGLEGGGPPDPLVLALLEHAEELHLDRGGEVPDLVEEEGAPGGQLEAPGLLPVRPREGPPLVAEQLGLEQGVGEGRAVDRHEGAVGPGAGVMDGAGHQLLPRPALARHQHGGLGGGHLGGPGERLAQEGGAAEDLGEVVAGVELGAGALQAVLQGLGAALERRDLDALPDRAQQLFVVKRFRQEVRGTGFERAHGHGDVPVAGEEYNGELTIRGGQLLLQVESVYPGEIHIQHQTTWYFGSRGSQELLRRRKGLRRQPGGLNQICQSFARRRIVIHHVNRSSCAAHGDLLGFAVVIYALGFLFKAVLTASSNSSSLNGFVKYPTVHSEAASALARLSEAWAVMKITGTLHFWATR